MVVEMVGEAHRRTQKEHFPKAIGQKMTGAEFHEFLQPVELKAWGLKVSSLEGIEPEGHCAAPGEEAVKQLGGRQCGNSNLKNTWGTQWEIICSS